LSWLEHSFDASETHGKNLPSQPRVNDAAGVWFPDVSGLLLKQFHYLSVILNASPVAGINPVAEMEKPDVRPLSARRNFFKEVCAIAIGMVAGLVPAVSGLLVFFDPLRRKTQDSGAVLVASLNALSEDGVPRKFSVIASHTDAWNRTPRVPVGAVYLRRLGDKRVQAFNVMCPHAGCFVDYDASRKGYHCPCHNSSFSTDGKIADPKSPSPRGLDELLVEIRNDNEIWVTFQNFRAGEKEKIPA
jgi:menaquinol-cytochrome c reductase iron-sulfur subunit